MPGSLPHPRTCAPGRRPRLPLAGVAALALLAGALQARSDEALQPARTAPGVAANPMVTGVAPAAARPGDPVQLFGQHLDRVSKVRLSGHGELQGLRASNGGTVLTGVLPAQGLPAGGAAATLRVYYPAGTGQRAFTVGGEFHLLPTPAAPGPQPKVTGMAPAAARPGDPVQLFGQHLDRVSKVRLSGHGELQDLRASHGGTVLTGVLPARGLPPDGADAPLRVYHPAGTGQRAFTVGGEFRILPTPAPRPEVTGVAPAAARPGDRVQLFGQHLDRVTRVRLSGHGELRRLRASRGGTVLTGVLPTRGLPPGGAAAPLRVYYPMGTGQGARTVGEAFHILPAAAAAPGPRPEVTGMAPAWGPPGTLVTLTGAHLDQVQQVHLGNWRVTLVPETPRSAHRLTFRIEGLLRPWTAAHATSAPVSLTTAPVAGWGPASSQRVVTGHFQVLPEGGDGDPACPEEPGWMLGQVKPGAAPGEHRFHLVADHLDTVYGARVNDRLCALEYHESHLALIHRTAPGDPDLRAARITLAFRGGSFQAPRALSRTLVCPKGFGPDYRRMSEPDAEVPVEAAVAIDRVVPAQARPGEQVLVYGRGLDRVTRLQVGGFGQVEWFRPSPTGTLGLAQLPRHWRAEAGAQVPFRIGAQAGPEVGSKARLLVLTGAAPALPAAGGLDLRLDCMYVTQAVQSRDGQVPLVQGRTACLRVFLVADRENQARPRVRVTVRDLAGRIRLEQDLTPFQAGVPTRINESSLLGGCDFPLVGGLIEPGMTVEARILDEAWAGRPGSTLTVAPVVVQVPEVRITLVPVRLGGRVGKVVGDGRTLDSWLETVRKVYPVGQVKVRVGEVWNPQLKEGSMDQAIPELVKELEARRTLADPWNLEYHYAVLPCAQDIHGLAHARHDRAGSLGRSMVGWDGADGADPERYHRTLAHELGHAFGLHHAPAGEASGPDPSYPDPAGHLDCAGFDLGTMTPIDSQAHIDIMGYGGFRWISAYHWRRALAHLVQDLALHGGRTGSAAAAPAAPSAAPETSLQVSGCIRDGKVLWFPALERPAGANPPAPGPYRLVALDADGFVLAEAPFQAREVPGHNLRMFEFALPMTEALRCHLATFQVHLDGRALPLRGSWDGKPLAPAGAGLGLGEPPPPVARRAADGTVRLAWDRSRYPKVLVLDPGTGAEVESRDGNLRTDAVELDLRLSDGVRTTRVRVPVL